MLMFGEAKTIPPFRDNLVILNLSSYIEGFERINIFPPFNISIDEKEFDINYANYILSNDNVFCEFMKIIMSLYYSLDVYVLVQHDNGGIFDIIEESLQKLIQQRYGICSNIINEVDDMDFCIDDMETMTQFGFANFDMDVDRYTYLTIDPDRDIVSE